MANTRLTVVEADITALDVDAIVNAANSALAPGGGVCGAIHAAAGPKLAVACARLGGCPTGSARITPGYDLKARYVVHAVGPVWHGGDRGEDGELASAYRESLKLATAYALRSIAFPAISTGIYGFPAARAAEIAVAAIRAELKAGSTVEDVLLACFGQASADLHRTALGHPTA